MVLRCLHQIEHLTRGHVVKVELGINAGLLRQGPVKFNHGIAQEDRLVELLAAVRVKFDKEPVGTRGNLHVGSYP